MKFVKNISKTVICIVAIMTLCSSLYSQIDNPKFTKVAGNDCGVENLQPFLIKGENYLISEDPKDSAKAATINFGKSVIYAFSGVDIKADYTMDLIFLSDQERIIKIYADGNPVCENIELTKGVEVRKTIPLPRKAFAYGELVLVFEAQKGPNAIVSSLDIYSTNKRQLKPFEGEAKIALGGAISYVVDTNVEVESVIPTYTPIPSDVNGVSNSKISLNGTWEFAEAEGAEFKSIQVPGQWSMQGFKVDSAGCGIYQRSFTTPNDWNGKQVLIRFDGVHSEYEVFLNGERVGYHLGGMTAYEINITDYLNSDNNEIMLKVRSESLADMLGSLTQYAAHQLGGITRKVTLFATPDVHIEDLRVVTDLDDKYTDAKLKIYTTVVNSGAKRSKRNTVNISLGDHLATLEYKLPAISAGKSWSGWIELDVQSPKLWNNESPNLYDINVVLKSSGVITEQITKRIGFREIEVKGSALLVNGKAVKLRGVCRHESHPTTGRVLTEELTYKDAKLYMEANCNFIRTSHYPPAEEFLNACDELGIFVEVESPICWIGHHANENWQVLDYSDPKYYDYVLQANMETMHFYRDHASVLFWSMANESYWNKQFAQVAEYMKKCDPTRPFAFHDQGYGGFNNQGSKAPINNIHYPGPNGYKIAGKSTRPIVYGEYCHLNVYNRSELVTDPGIRSDWALALAPTWENMYLTDAILGGSIWSGIDDIFQLPNGDAVGYGPWGPIDGWRRPKPEYWDMKKIYSPIRLATKLLSPSSTLTVDVENRYTFTDFNELKIIYRYGVEEGVITTSLAPKHSGKISIDIENPNAANELHLTFIDKKGFVADEFNIPVGKQVQNEVTPIVRKKSSFTEAESVISIAGEGFLAEVDSKTGQIITVKKDGIQVISGGPWLMALPLTGGGCLPSHDANTPIFNDVCSDWSASSVNVSSVGDDVVVAVLGSYNEFKGGYVMTFQAGGEVVVEYDFDALEGVNPRQWGLVFDAPLAFDQTFWRRSGMWSVYPKDHISRPFGTADLFYKGIPETIDPRSEPSWAWSRDYNELGSNDFRSTRRNIWFAGLTSKEGASIIAVSNGEQHWRSWKNGNKIEFLIADFVTAGDELFLGSYYAPFRKQIKIGDSIRGKIKLQVSSTIEETK